MDRTFYSLIFFIILNIAKGNDIHEIKESIARNAETLKDQSGHSDPMPVNKIPIDRSILDRRIPNDLNETSRQQAKAHIKNSINTNVGSNPFQELTNVTPTSFNQTFRQKTNIHISEFTNPKTGLNPFLDLIEGTSNNTRNTSLTNIPKRIVHVIIPSKQTNKQKSEKEPLADKKTLAGYNRHIPIDLHNNWLHHGKMHLDPVEGDSGRRSFLPLEPIEEPASKRNRIFHLGTLNAPTLNPRVNRKLTPLSVNNKKDRLYINSIHETSTTPFLNTVMTERNHNVSFNEYELQNTENNHSNLPNISVTRLRPKNTTHMETADLAPKIIPVITCVTLTVLAFLFAVHFCNKRSKRISNPNSIIYEVRKDRTEKIFDLVEEPHRPLNKEVIK